MATTIIPDITIHIYADEVKTTADYTVSQVALKYLLENIPTGTYWFKCVGTYGGKPIAEEYRSFIVNEASITNWMGTTIERVGEDPQDFNIDTILGISQLTVTLTHDGANYSGGSVFVGKDTSRYTPREAIEDGVTGNYLLSNVVTGDNIKIKAIPDSADTDIQEESDTYKVDSNNIAHTIELFSYFYFKVYLMTTTGETININAAALKVDNTIVETLTLYYTNMLRTVNKIHKGTYTLYIPASTINDTIRFKAINREITIDNTSDEVTIWLETEPIPDSTPGDTTDPAIGDEPINNL